MTSNLIILKALKELSLQASIIHVMGHEATDRAFISLGNKIHLAEEIIKKSEAEEYTLIHEFEDGEESVGMVIHQDVVFVATNKHIYRVINDVLVPLKVERLNDE